MTTFMLEEIDWSNKPLKGMFHYIRLEKSLDSVYKEREGGIARSVRSFLGTILCTGPFQDFLRPENQNIGEGFQMFGLTFSEAN